MTWKKKLTVAGGALVFLVVLARLTVIKICYPTSKLHESATITVKPSQNGCVVDPQPEEIRTQWQHKVTWTIQGSCPNHTVSVVKFGKDGQALDPTDERTREVKAEDGQVIRARAKVEGEAPRGVYTYQVAIDGQPAGGDPEFRICPDWPC